jgi:DNA polymerase I-like protein with 3'-5' exonuclease and polymerase domains
MIRVVTNQETGYSGNWDEFVKWVTPQTELQFDIETNVTTYWCTKQVKTLQFGDLEGQVQYVLEYSNLSTDQLQVIKQILESWSVLKLIHRASFEYVVLAFHSIEVHNVYCTLVAEKVLQGGAENIDYALTDLTAKYLGITLDKTLQTSFGDGILTKEKVEYAAEDVIHLGKIKALQDVQTKKWGLENVMWLEMRSLLAFSECTFHGVILNQEKWRANIDLAQPVVDESKRQLDQWILDDSRLLAKAVEFGYYKTEDTVNFNLNSPLQKFELLKLVFPDITGASLGILRSYMRDNNNLPADKMYILVTLLEKDTTEFSKYLLTHYKEQLIEMGLVLPAGNLTINWNSRDQALQVLQGVEPKLKSLSEEALGKVSHPVFEQLSDYKDSLKLTSSYGEKFIEKHVEPDGRVRTNYNQVVSTGRSSSANPNCQNIPAKPAVGARYRECFGFLPDWLIVGSDYSSQELNLIAHASQDPVWIDALKNGEDLHGITAAMVFKTKWEAAQQPGCTYYNPSYVLGEDVYTVQEYIDKGKPDGATYFAGKQKCRCKGHKNLRSGVKSLNFGLCYGMSKYKLSASMRSTVQEAQQLIDQYFKTFPKIKQTLDAFGLFGVENGYTQTLAPFFRKRFFTTWEGLRTRIPLHRSGVEFNPGLGRIERQSKNSPIQGSAADMVKLAMWKVYKYIRDYELQNKVHLLLNVHDELITTTEKAYAPEWAVKFDSLMLEAANLIIPSGLLKAETTISESWTK